MSTVMRKDHDFGVIPGTGKPSLYKPGSEKILSMFNLAAQPQVEDLSTPDCIRYRVTITVIHTPTSTIAGYGVGEASSAESKYQWRAAVCDEEWNETPDDRKRLKWKKGYQGSPASSTRQIRADMEDVANCVTPETLILTHDLQWVPAGEIETGDMLIGVEEDLTNDYARHLAVGEVTVYGRRTDFLYEITFDDGRKVRCNGEHQWLVKKIGLKGTQWVSTQDIYEEIVERKGRPRKWTVMSVCRPWDEDKSKEGGYLAGLLDADGTLSTPQVRVMFAQQQNTVLARMESGLAARGYRLSTGACKTQEQLDQTVHGKQVYNLRLLGEFAEQLRLLGSIRPPRLLERWLACDVGIRRLEGRGSGAGKSVEITSIESIGEGEIVMLGTSCHTYIAEGLVCHNTILKMAKKRAQIDAVLTTTAASDVFAQDLEDLVAAGLDLQPDATEFPTTQAPLPQELQRKTDAPPAQQQPQQRAAQPQQQPAQRQAPPPQSGVRLISGPQASRFWAIAMQYHKDHTKITGYLHNVLGVQKKDDIPVSRYDEAIAWAEGKED
jgi:hypothetical protein